MVIKLLIASYYCKYFVDLF